MTTLAHLALAFWMFWFPQYVATVPATQAQASSATLSSTCMAQNSGTNVSCTLSSLTTANTLIDMISLAGSTETLNMSSSSGAGCPSSWTQLVSSTGFGVFIGTAAGSGSCSVEASFSGSAIGLQQTAFATSGGLGANDGNGSCSRIDAGAGTQTGASYSISNTDLALGFAYEETGTDASWAIVSPFLTSSPGQITTTPPQLGAYYTGATTTITIKYVTGTGTHSDSCVLGVH